MGLKPHGFGLCDPLLFAAFYPMCVQGTEAQPPAECAFGGALKACMLRGAICWLSWARDQFVCRADCHVLG